MKLSPFDRERFIGYVSSVTPTTASICFPTPKLLERFYYDGDILHGGLVGNYVVIEGHGYGLLAKTIKVMLEDKLSSYQSHSALSRSSAHPVAIVEFQLSFDSFSLTNEGAGIEQYPEIGARVFACQLSILEKLIKDFGSKPDTKSRPDDLLELVKLDSDSSKIINISANALLSRHCAIVGTTGSGKSYTLAKLIEELTKRKDSKIVLLDATGEFEEFGRQDYGSSLKFGVGGDANFPYQKLTESDLFALFRPAGQTQEPILQQAIRSLKLAKTIPDNQIVSDGNIVKTNLLKATYTSLYKEHEEQIEDELSDFDISKIMKQIEYECVYDSTFGQSRGERIYTKWGDPDLRQLDNCTSLIRRISNLRVKSGVSTLFGFKKQEGLKEFTTEFSKFYQSDKKLLLVDISQIPTDSNARDIFSNAVGRFFLEGLRKQSSNFTGFKDKPLVLMVDEAHLIFEKEKVKDEFSNEYRLDAFAKLAKESRKYGLFLCLSTQRPSDIPPGVLSQMGTFIAHRLINDRDIEAIKNSVQDSSLGLLSFLPTFKKGQALLTGNEFPMPIVIQTNCIGNIVPKSNTPILFSKDAKAKDDMVESSQN